MKAFIKMGFLALTVSFFTSCTPDQPLVDSKPGGIDSLDQAKGTVPEDTTTKASVEEVDSNGTVKETAKDK